MSHLSFRVFQVHLVARVYLLFEDLLFVYGFVLDDIGLVLLRRVDYLDVKAFLMIFKSLELLKA